MKFSQKATLVMIAFFSFLSMPGAVYGATPIVDTTIELRKTGSEPFNTSDGDDDCADGNTFDTSKIFFDGSAIEDGDDGIGHDGKDTCADNDVVRLGDSITYKVEISVNDSDVDFLTSTVTLDPYDQSTQLPDAAGTIHQEWITIPSGCETDPLLATPVSELLDNTGDGYNETLFCNMGFAREGTNKVFFPASKVIGTATDGSKATLNDSILGASVSAEGISNSDSTGNNGTSTTESDGPAEALVTADFRVNLIKEMVGFGFDGDGNPIWPKLDEKPGPGGEEGYLAKFDVKAVYQKGSMIADSEDELVDTDEDGFFYDADFDILDIFTDDNTLNDAALSSGALLYTWDSAQPACTFNGDNGVGATLTCTQTDYPVDWSGPSFISDGFDDPNFHIDLDNIDTRDPDGDGTLFNARIHLWIPKADVESHPTCGDGACQYFHINEAQALDITAEEPAEFAPVSTEDASENNLDNYGAGNEPGGVGSADEHTANSDNITNGLLLVSDPGVWTYRKTFQRTTDSTANLIPKIAEQLRAKGEEFPVALLLYDYRLIDGGKSQICDKIDTTQYEFTGVPTWNQWPTYPSLDSNLVALWYDVGPTTRYPRPTQNNPSLRIWGGTEPDNILLFADAQSQTQSLYSAVPNGTGSLADLDTATCEDDVDGVGGVVIMDSAGNLVDENGTPTTGTPDWYEDYTMVPPAGDGTSGVTKIRFQYIYDAAWITAEHEAFGGSGHQNVYAGQLYNLKVREDATGYGAKSYMPNYADARRSENTDNNTWTAWQDNATDAVQDPTNVSFGYNIYSADRNILVPSGISVGKKTVPEGLKVVRGGDIVQFEIIPTVFGLWADTQTSTLTDNLPPGTDYIGGSEEFSIDGGTTWMDYATYQASSPDVTLTSAGTPSAQDPIVWSFGSLDAGDQMPRIRYKVLVDPTLTSGNFKNTVTFSSPNIAADKLTIDTDDDEVGDTGDGVGDDVFATYKLTILPKYGFDVLKQVGKEVYNVNESFIFDLTYKNLGSETYTGGSFIDILPFEGDALTTIGGIDSVRDPETIYNGIYTFESASFSNGEVFWVTDEDPSNLNLDPCASSNTPDGYEPDVDDLCYQDYINNGNQLPDGVAAGTGDANWQACTPGASPLDVAADCPIAPIDVTAVRFEPPSVPTSGGKTVSLEIKPIGNFGGDPVYTFDSNGLQIVDWSNSPNIGDVYTNSFGGRIPEISLNVISNDVSVTPVWGSVGGELWWDLDDDGTGQGTEEPIADVDLTIFDSAGNPIWIDPITGVTILDADKAAYEALTGTTLEQYIVTTGTDGSYSFENLPAGDYSIEVVTIPGNETWDIDDLLTAADSSADFTLAQEVDPITGNIIGVTDRDDVDFGYIPYLFDVELQKSLITPAPYYIGQVVEFQITALNNGPDPVSDLEITDSATGLTYVADSEVATQGSYAAGVWTVGDLANTQTETLNINYTITATSLTDSVFNFAEVTSDGDFGSDIDSQPGDNTSGTGPDDEESDAALSSGTDTHDDEAGVPLTLVPGPAIKITKTAGDATDGVPYLINADGTVTFTYLVENTGGMDLADITITDDAGTPSDATDDTTLTNTQCADLAGPLAPDATVTCAADLTVNLADSPYANTATTEGVPVDENGDAIPGFDNPTDNDPAEILAPPSITIVKTAGDAADGSTYSVSADGTVTFTYLVENTGGTYLTNITITDDAGTPSDAADDVTLTSAECTELAGPLAPAGTVTCTLDLDVSGTSHVNSATTSGTPTTSAGDPLLDASDNPLFGNPEDTDDATVAMSGIAIIKTAGDATDGVPYVINADGTVTFTYLVENTGGTYLTDMTITDDAGTPADATDDVTLTSAECAELAGPLAPATTVTCTSDLTVDLVSSPYSNNAATEGIPAESDGTPIAGVENPVAQDPAEVLAPPAIEIVKTAGDALDGVDFITNDDEVLFTYNVTNTGGTYLTNITITDDVGTPSDTADDTTLTSTECAELAGPLTPADSVECTVTLAVAEINYTNTAGVSGTPTDVDGNELVNDTGDPFFENPEDNDGAVVLKPAISLNKALYEGHDSGEQCDTESAVNELVIVDKTKADRDVTYCFTVENTGPVDLTSIELDDAVLGIDHTDMGILSGSSPLLPGEKMIFYYETQTDTSIDNTATVEALPADGNGDPIETNPVSDTDSNALLVYVADPPFGEKVGTLEGRDIINWDMVWINDSAYLATDVIIRDEPPVDTEYNGSLACSGAGSTVVHSCEYFAPDATYPRGHVKVVADIAPDPGVRLVENASNALTISFDVLVTTTETKTFENQAELEWDADGDGVTDFNGVSDNPNTGDLGDISTIVVEGIACQEYEHEDIEGYIYIDDDRDGKKDNDENGIKNVTVYLKDENGNVIAQTETDSDGMYKFGKYPPGKYTIDIKTSDKDLRGYTITNEDGDTTALNGIDQITHRCDANSNTDFGYLESGSVLAKTGTNLLLWVGAGLLALVSLFVAYRHLRRKH